MVTSAEADSYRAQGAHIIRELIKSKQFEKYAGHKMQLTVFGVLGRMEAGKSTLFRYLNLLSDADKKLSWDDKSLKTLKQEQISEFVLIRHIYPDERILLLIAAHRFYLLPKTFRDLCHAMIWVSKPPAWAIHDRRLMKELEAIYQLKWPNRPYHGLILWTNWTTWKDEWGWVVWDDIQDEVPWDQTDFITVQGTGVSMPNELTLDGLLSGKQLAYPPNRSWRGH